MATHTYSSLPDHRLMSAYALERWPWRSVWSLLLTEVVDTQNDHSPGGRCTLKNNFSLFVKDPLYKVSTGEAIWNISNIDTRVQWLHYEENSISICTKSTAKFFKVDKAILILVYQAEYPQRQGALSSTEGPWLQKGEEQAELVIT